MLLILAFPPCPPFLHWSYILVSQMKGVSDQLTAAMEDNEAEGKEEEET